MTTQLYMHFLNPYNAAQSGLTVEAWDAGAFTHSPVGNPGAYPPPVSHVATTTTDSSGNCELTGLTVGNSYYVSIIDINGKPWFFSAPASALGNSSGTRRVWAFNPDPTPAPPPTINWPQKFNQPIPTGFIAAPLDGTWYTNGLAVPVFCIITFSPDDGTIGNYGGVSVYGSDDGGVTPVSLGSYFDTIAVGGDGFENGFPFICPAGSSWKWHSAYATGGGRTKMDLFQAVYYY